jgi:hypothetical protein
MAVSGTESVVKFQVLPLSGVDMPPPVAPNAQAPAFPKLASASFKTSEMSSQPAEAVSMPTIIFADQERS